MTEGDLVMTSSGQQWLVEEVFAVSGVLRVVHTETEAVTHLRVEEVRAAPATPGAGAPKE